MANRRPVCLIFSASFCAVFDTVPSVAFGPLILKGFQFCFERVRLATQKIPNSKKSINGLGNMLILSSLSHMQVPESSHMELKS